MHSNAAMNDTDTPAGRQRALAFAIHDCARAIRHRFNDVSRPLQMTQAQYRILIYVNRQPGISQKALADLLEIRPISLTRQLDRLGEAGLIERRPNPADRRAFALHLAPAAAPVLAKIRQLGAQVMQSALEGMSEAEQSCILEGLKHMKNNLDRGEAP